VRLVASAVFVPLRAVLRAGNRWLVSGGSESPREDPVRRVGLVPHFVFLSGFGPTAGATVYVDDLTGHAERAHVRADAGGRTQGAVEIGFEADRTAGTDLWLETSTRFERRPAEAFHGIGPNDGVASRFSEDRLTMVARAGETFGHRGELTQLGLTSTFTAARFGPEGRVLAWSNDDASIESVYDTRSIRGFAEGATTLDEAIHLRVDTRQSVAAPSNGVRLDAFAGGVPPLARWRYVHYGADLRAYFDLYKGNRVLALRVALDAVEGESDRVPFSSLPSLGGPAHLRGYTADRYRDRKAALASAEYDYPIHSVVSGALFVDAGRVAPGYESLARGIASTRFGGGVGVRIRTKEAELVALDVAYGEGVSLFVSVFPSVPAAPRSR
jgi:hypothetical protein